MHDTYIAIMIPLEMMNPCKQLYNINFYAVINIDFERNHIFLALGLGFTTLQFHS